MATIVSCSLNKTQHNFLIEKKISPTKLLQIKVDELMNMSSEKFNTTLKSYVEKGMNKWQRALWKCENDEEREELIDRFIYSIS